MRLVALIIFTITALHADTALSPTLQWVQSFGGSGASQVIAAAADADGNLYIAGNTSSVDFPVTSAAQSHAGGSTLFRVNTGNGAGQALYPPGLSNANSIAADPQNPMVLYATQENAIWRSTDGGNTWSSTYSFAQGTTATSIAVDPASHSTLYAATDPAGIYMSTDGGATWTAMNIGIPAVNGAIETFRIYIDPHNSQLLFAFATVPGNNYGVLRSSDGGKSWSVLNGQGYPAGVVFDPFVPETLYIAVGSQINKSTDGGATFTTLSSLPNQDFPSALIADQSHQGVLYAGGYNGIYQSVDDGVTWTMKQTGICRFLVADPATGLLYAGFEGNVMVRSADGFTTYTAIGSPGSTFSAAIAAGSFLFVVASPSTDAFVVKLDNNGNVVYSTYFGGSGSEVVGGIAVGGDGSVYMTGTTTSQDLPVTPNAYATSGPVPDSPFTYGSNFLLKLNADGSRAWSTYFADASTTALSIVVDSAGNPIIGGKSSGSLPTTTGAYQPSFHQIWIGCGIAPCVPGPTSAFVTKFAADGSRLTYSTYIPTDLTETTAFQSASALALDNSGNAYFAGGSTIGLLSANGASLSAFSAQPSVNFVALARDRDGDVYATGATATYLGEATFPATTGAFQVLPQPAIPSLPGETSGTQDAFVMKFDAGLDQLLAATLLGGESSDVGESIAIDPAGNIIVAGQTDSKAFPTRAPFQSSFSPRAGFVAELNNNLSTLLFSTYVGDIRPFDARAAVADTDGNILLAGSTLTNNSGFLGGDPGYSFSVGDQAFVNKIAIAGAPSLGLDSVVNEASRLAAAVAPGETIQAIGSGFQSNAQLLVDGDAVPLISSNSTSLVAAIPMNGKTSGAFQFQVSSGGAISHPVFVPAALASPGIFTVDGSGVGQSYILNSDGTVNSAANPTSPGSLITIYATGAGQLTLQPSVFIDGFYANGNSATTSQMQGLPGTTYQLKVYVPDPAKLVANNPNLLNFTFPSQVGVRLVFGDVNSLNPDNSTLISQPGVVLNIKQ